MHQKLHRRLTLEALALMTAGLLVFPPLGLAQASTVTGDASAVQATVLGTTTVLADSGFIGATNMEQDAAQNSGSVASLLTADVLTSSTYSYVDEVDSESSLGGLNMTVNLPLGLGAVSITADSVLAEASQVLGAPGSGTSFIDNLEINGVPISVTGDPNQTVAIPGGQVVINEQTISSTGTAVVNALHVTVTGVADVVIASATAGIS